MDIKKTLERARRLQNNLLPTNDHSEEAPTLPTKKRTPSPTKKAENTVDRARQIQSGLFANRAKDEGMSDSVDIGGITVGVDRALSSDIERVQEASKIDSERLKNAASPHETDAAATSMLQRQFYQEAPARAMKKQQEDDVRFLRDTSTKKYGNNIGGQFGANFRIGEIGVRKGKTGHERMQYDSEHNDAYVSALDVVAQRFQQNNAETLQSAQNQNPIVRTFVTEFAQNIPQQLYMLPAKTVGGIIGAALGGYKGFKAGAAIGTTGAMYQLEAGNTYNDLVAAGVDKKTAKALANDVGLLNSALEGVDEYITLGLAGAGKVATALGVPVKQVSSKLLSAATKSMAGKVFSAVGRFALTGATEYAEEYLQEASGMAADRVANINDDDAFSRLGMPGMGNLLSQWADVLKRTLSPQSVEDYAMQQQARAAGRAGAVTGWWLGGFGMARNAALAKVINTVNDASIGKSLKGQGAYRVAEAISAGLYSNDKNVQKIATKIQQAQENGSVVTDKQLGSLVRAMSESVQKQVQEAQGNEKPVPFWKRKAEADTIENFRNPELGVTEDELNDYYAQLSAAQYQQQKFISDFVVYDLIQQGKDAEAGAFLLDGLSETERAETIGELIAAREDFDENSAASIMSRQLENKMRSGEKISDEEVAHLYAANVLAQVDARVDSAVKQAFALNEEETALIDEAKRQQSADTSADRQAPSTLTNPVFTGARTEQITQMAQSLGATGAQTLSSIYNTDVEPADFFSDAARAYNMGSTGADLPQGAAIGVLTPAQTRAMYLAGAVDGGFNQNDRFGGVIRNEQNNLLLQGRNGDVSQRPGGQTGAVQAGTGRDGKVRKNAGAPADPDSANLRRGKKVSATDMHPAARKSQKVYLDESNTQAVRMAKALAQRHGVNIVLFAGDNIVTTDAGKNHDARAFYNAATKTLYVRTDSADATGYELSQHELMEHLIATGAVKVDDIIAAAEKYVSAKDINTIVQMYTLGTDDETAARKEMVCDGGDHINQMQTMIDEGGMEANDANRYFAALNARVIDALHRAAMDATDGAIEVEAEQESTSAEKGETELTNDRGDVIGKEDGNGGIVLSERTWNEGGKAALEDFIEKQTKDPNGLTKQDGKSIMDSMQMIYNIMRQFRGKYATYDTWSSAKVDEDGEGNPIFSVVKSNGEYAMNIDFSTVCKKRRTMDAVFNEMIRMGILQRVLLNEKGIATINQIIRKNGMETACDVCFVDAKRYRSYNIANQFAQMYNEMVQSLRPAGSKTPINFFNYAGNQKIVDVKNALDSEGAVVDTTKLEKRVRDMEKSGKTKTVEYGIAKYLLENPSARRYVLPDDFISTNGITAVTRNNPALLSLYNRKKGTGGAKSTLPDVQYLHEIIKKQKFNRDKAYAVGGVRIQSFSDYIARLVFDYVEMVGDLAAKKLPAHSYTKESLFALQFGLTGIKINLSLIPRYDENGIAAGLDADGNYAWMDGQSFGSTTYGGESAAEGFELAKRIQNDPAYSKNCGTIAIGVSDEQIRKMLDDENIRMIIPYHRSSLNPIVAEINHIMWKKGKQKFGFTNYEAEQTTKGRDGKKLESGDFLFNDYMREHNCSAKEAADAYLAWCNGNGYTPKFQRFADSDNYYKLLIDYVAYDAAGQAAPQGDVHMAFPGMNGEAATFGTMEQLIESGLDADNVLQGQIDSSVDKIIDDIKTHKGKDGKLDLYDPKRKTIYENSERLPADKLSEFVKKRDEDYLAAVDRGDMETAQKMVDEAAKAAGYRVEYMYHGDPDPNGHNILLRADQLEDVDYDPEPGNLGYGIYFTPDRQYAARFGHVQKFYLKYNNVADITNDEYVKKTLEAVENDLYWGDDVDEDDRSYDFYDTGEVFDELIERLGADAVKGTGVGGLSYGAPEITVRESWQAKLADPVTYDDKGNLIPLSERFNPNEQDIRRSERLPADRLREFVEQYGEIEEGEIPARESHYPKRTGEREYVSENARTFREAGVTTDELLPTLDKLVADGELSFHRINDKAAIADARSYIANKGWAAALTEFMNSMKSGVVGKNTTALGYVLYDNAVTKGDNETAISILNAMVANTRSAAQALQAVRILKRLSPDAQLYGIQQSIGSMQEELKEKYGDKAPDLHVDDELLQEFRDAKDDEGREAATRKIYKQIAEQMPTRFIDRWNAWRYLAMLCNVRTHVRNVLGNLGFAPIVAIKDLTASGIEAAVSAVTGNKLKRNKAFVTGLTQQDRSILSAAWKDYANVEDQALGEGKYSDLRSANKMIEENRKIFGNTRFNWWNKTGGKALEAVRKFNNKALDIEDVWFSKPHYAYALAQYCKQHGITAEMISEGGKALDAARSYAIKEAQKATYRDTNALSSTIASFGRSASFQQNAVQKGVGIIMEGILPFRKTPANILARGLEYSPLGLLKAITYNLAQVKKGNMTGADAIDAIAAGLTGTGLLALGLFLAAQGRVRGHGSGDDKKRDFEKMQGHQAYALEVGDKSITLDWLAPEALPFFVGVNLWENSQNGKNPATLSEILQAITNVSEPMLEMSCLQSLNNLFDSLGYAKSNDTSALMSILTSAATSYLTQAVPTVLGQAERTGEDKRYTTYTEKNAFLTGDLQYIIGKQTAKIPGVEFQQIPYIDAWGREELTGAPVTRAANNFVNPAYVSKISDDKREEELLRLYDATGDGGVLPQRAKKYIGSGENRKDLTAAEYVKYATAKGQTSYALVSELMSSDEYRNAPDDVKAEMIASAYQYADQTARTTVGVDINQSWVEKALDGYKDNKIPVSTYIIARNITHDIEGIKDKNDKTITNSKGLQIMEAIYGMDGLTEKQRKYLFASFGVGKKVIKLNKTAVAEKLKKIRKK